MEKGRRPEDGPGAAEGTGDWRGEAKCITQPLTVKHIVPTPPSVLLFLSTPSATTSSSSRSLSRIAGTYLVLAALVILTQCARRQ